MQHHPHPPSNPAEVAARMRRLVAAHHLARGGLMRDASDLVQLADALHRLAADAYELAGRLADHAGNHGAVVGRLTGAADAILVLKRDASAGMCVLHGRGRDIEDFEKALTFDKGFCVWKLIGDAAEHRLTKERRTIVEAVAGAGEPIGPKDIAAAAGMKEANVKFLLRKLLEDGGVERAQDGKGHAIAGKYVARAAPGR